MIEVATETEVFCVCLHLDPRLDDLDRVEGLFVDVEALVS